MLRLPSESSNLEVVGGGGGTPDTIPLGNMNTNIQAGKSLPETHCTFSHRLSLQSLSLNTRSSKLRPGSPNQVEACYFLQGPIFVSRALKMMRIFYFMGIVPSLYPLNQMHYFFQNLKSTAFFSTIYLKLQKEVS